MEEDLIDIDNPLHVGDLYDSWEEDQYLDFEALQAIIQHEMYSFNLYGHEDGDGAYAAELFAEEELEQEIAEEYAWEDHLNPIQAFERDKIYLLDTYGIYPDRHDGYKWYELRAEEAADEFGPEPRNDDECQY